MFRAECTRLRQSLAREGVVAAAGIPEAAGRPEEACIQPARIIEGGSLAAIPVGAASPCDGPLAFLDGTQRSEVLAYAGSSPLLLAEASAAVRCRTERVLRSVVSERTRFAVGRPETLTAAAPALGALAWHDIDDDQPPHPLRDMELARRVVDQVRGSLELEVYHRFRSSSDDWLVVDGALSVSPALAADRRAIGVSKSHTVLPFAGEELVRYLHLPAGCRSSLFVPGGERAPVVAWALRLWPFEGKGLLHGLVRIEVAPANGTPVLADAISRWILAERVPLSGDPRWDRLLYGIHSVEQYLKAGAR